MAGRDGFVNLHTHSEYSLLDGFGHVQEYVNRAIELNQSSLGLTDHGNLYGIFSFIKACQKSGIKPIPGIEAYFAPQNPKGARCHERILYGRPGQESLDVASRGAYLHQTLFALNNEGMRNLYSLVRESSLEGNDYSHLPLEKGEGNFYQKPRMDFDMLARWHDGIIATTGCPSGEIQTRFRLGQDDEAYDYARRMMELFPDRYFVEVMNHNMPNSTVESSVIMKLVEMSEKLHLPLLATNDAHYCRKEDASHHEEMLCLNSGAAMSDTIYDNGGKRFAFSGDEYYLKSEAEIRSALPSDKFPNAVENTLMLADMVEDIHFEMEDDLRPVVEIPEGKTEVDVFKEKIKAGFIKKRLESGDDEERIEASKKEIAHEMPVFTENNFVQYMLVVADYINWAKEHGIGVGPARGSAGGSEIANLLGITDIDPIRHDLMFERFLNPERLSPPDVDTDFAATRRDEVLDYVKTKYGEDHICNIVTFGRFLSKTAISTMAKIYDIPLPEANAAKELIPDAANGKAASFSECYDPSSQYYAQAVEFRERMSRPEWKKAFAAARAIEGRVKQVGVHACGVIMSSHPITDAAPFTYAHNPKKPWGSSCSQWTYEELESIGLIKMDFLSLSDLDIVKEALDNISHTHDGQVPDMKKLVHGKMDDEKTYAMLGKGDTLGIFQMSSTGMASLFKRMKPDSFEDIMASIALYRPGPMGMDAHIKYADRKNGTEPDIVLDPHFTDTPVEEILASTHQLLVYQEEVMRISMQVAGFSLGEADGLRKAMGHKKMDVMAEMKPKFIDGAIERGYDRDAIIKLWNYMEEFGKYGFNASHSAAYGIISYETAYLKAHYPTEFMAAYLSDKIRNAKKPDDVKVVIREAREIGLKMSAIDVNESGLTMSAVKKISPSDPDIVYGFAGIGGVSTKVAQQIIDARDANGGSFSSVDDFMRALPPSLAGKKVIIDGIAGAGGFDRFGVSRRSVVACVEEMADYYKSETKNAAMGKQSLFDMLDDSDDDSSDDDFNESFTVPDMREWDWLTKLEQEGNRIGNAVSGHPMSNVGNGLRFLKAGYSVLQDEYGIPKTVDELLSVKIGSHEYNGRRFYDDVPVRVIASVPLFKTGVNRRGSKFISGQIESPSASMSFRVNGQDMENLVTDNIIQNHVYLITGNLTIDWNGNHSLSPRIFEEVELDHDGRIPIWLHVGEKVVSSTRSKGYMKLMEVLDAHPGDIPVMLHVKDDNGFLSVYDTEKGVEFSRELASQLEHLVGMKRFGRWPRE